MIFFGAAVSGFGKPKAESCVIVTPKMIHKAINKSISYPALGSKLNLDGEVVLVFRISDGGKIDIRNISAENTDLSNYVKQQLSGITIKDMCSPSNQFYKLKINFQPS